MISNTTKEFIIFKKKLHNIEIILFIIGILVALLFVWMTIFMYSGSPNENPGQKMARGMIPGMVFYYIIEPVGTVIAIASLLRSLYLFIRLRGIIYDKFFYFGCVGIILCILPVAIIVVRYGIFPGILP